MAYEYYSAQTRQVKTAMTLTATTLAIFTFFGTPVSHSVKVPPGQFEVPSGILFWLFLGSSAYFFASFLMSAIYDKNNNEARGIFADIDDVREAANALQAQTESYFSQFDDTFKAVIRHISQDVRKIDYATLASHLENSTNNSPKFLRNALETLAKYQNEEEFIKTTAAMYALPQKEGRSNLEKKISALDGKIAKSKSQSEGISRLHNHIWEFQLPVMYSGVLIFASLFIRLFHLS